MAHIQQQEFCKSIKDKFPDFLKNKFVLDIGSLDINGNNQEYFENSNYIGVDIAYGRNVDIVSKGHELGFPDNTFDIIISTECFEHDQYYVDTIKNIYRMLKPGGLFIFTCATTGRPEHGTRRTTPEDAPLLQTDIEWSDYYKNLTENDIREVLNVEDSFVLFEFSTNEISYDLYFYGFKKGNYLLRDDYSFLLSNKPRQLRIFIQLFIEDENGLKEENSIKYPVLQTTELQRFEFDLKDFDNIKNLRLDPLNDSCVINIFEVYLVLEDDSQIDLKVNIQANICSFTDDSYFFEMMDSQIYFEKVDFGSLSIKKFVIELVYNYMAKDAVHICANQIAVDHNCVIKSKEETIKELYFEIENQNNTIENQNNTIENQNNTIENQNNELISIYTSKSWKITRLLRNLARKLRKR